MVRPMADLGLYLADMTDWPQPQRAGGAVARRQRRLPPAGARPARHVRPAALAATSPTAPRSRGRRAGWTNDRNVTQMLEFLASRGVVAVAGRRGRHRLWDLAERVYPAGTPVVPADEARRIRDEKRLRSLGVARPQFVGDAGITGRGRGHLRAVARRPGGDRRRLRRPHRACSRRSTGSSTTGPAPSTCSTSSTSLEMYKPKAKRRWGYFALPVLHHDRLIGKVDAAADRKASQLQVHAIHQDVRFTRAINAGVDAELDALAALARPRRRRLRLIGQLDRSHPGMIDHATTYFGGVRRLSKGAHDSSNRREGSLGTVPHARADHRSDQELRPARTGPCRDPCADTAAPAARRRRSWRHPGEHQRVPRPGHTGGLLLPADRRRDAVRRQRRAQGGPLVQLGRRCSPRPARRVRSRWRVAVPALHRRNRLLRGQRRRDDLVLEAQAPGRDRVVRRDDLWSLSPCG